MSLVELRDLAGPSQSPDMVAMSTMSGAVHSTLVMLVQLALHCHSPTAVPAPLAN